jgi:hypothetical protein
MTVEPPGHPAQALGEPLVSPGCASASLNAASLAPGTGASRTRQ